MVTNSKREMTIWEAADIIACMIGSEERYTPTDARPDEDQKHKALEVAFKTLRYKADKSYCQHIKNSDGTYHKCIMPFTLCTECPINRYLIGQDISEEEMAKAVINLGWEELLTPECKQRLHIEEI